MGNEVCFGDYRWMRCGYVMIVWGPPQLGMIARMAKTNQGVSPRVLLLDSDTKESVLRETYKNAMGPMML